MNLGYHTAGLLLHDEASAISELGRIGYRTVAIRPRRGSFNPFDQDFPSQANRISSAVKHAGIELVIDANSQFIHDVWRPIEPSLASRFEKERSVAANWIRRLIDVASELPASCITLSSGAPDNSAENDGGGAEDDASPLDRLAEQLNFLSDYAGARGVKLMLRPASKTFVTNVAGYERFQQWLRPSSKLGLAADIGEMLVSGELPVSERLARNANFLGGVFLRDVTQGLSGDQRIGHGEINLARILASLANQGYLGWAIVCVEGHEKYGLSIAEEAFERLKNQV